MAGKDVIFVLTTPLKQTAQCGMVGGNRKAWVVQKSRKKHNFMESLANNKFSQLTSDEMNSIEGGWGWRVTNVGYVKLEGASEGTSIINYQYYNIWGNPTDKYKETYD